MPEQYTIQGGIEPARNMSLVCSETNPKECECCGETFTDTVMRRTGNLEIICPECAENSYVTLLDNGDLYHIDDCVWSDICGCYLHQDDACFCTSCEEYGHDSGEWHTLRHGGQVCGGCYESGDWQYPADDSDYLHHIDDLYWSEFTEEYYCDYDNVPENNASGPLYCYSTNVLDQIDYIAYLDDGRVTSTFGKHLLFGVELETGSRGDCPEDIAAQLIDDTNFQDYGICKEDGSISGIELVTLPATLSAHKSTYSWNQWCKTMRPIARGHYGNAGMHVHINRGAVSQLTLGKMLVFTNSLGNTAWLNMIAQRDIHNISWCKQDPSKFDKVGKAALDCHAGKYSVLNVTRNTIECRIFNSSLVPERIYKNIEFCHALVKFCEKTSARNLHYTDMGKFIEDNQKDYPNLAAFIKKPELLICA